MNRRIIAVAMALVAVAVIGIAAVPDNIEGGIGTYTGGSNASTSSTPYSAVTSDVESVTIYVKVGGTVSTKYETGSSMTVTSGFGLSVHSKTTGFSNQYSCTGTISTAGTISINYTSNAGTITTMKIIAVDQEDTTDALSIGHFHVYARDIGTSLLANRSTAEFAYAGFTMDQQGQSSLTDSDFYTILDQGPYYILISDSTSVYITTSSISMAISGEYTGDGGSALLKIFHFTEAGQMATITAGSHSCTFIASEAATTDQLEFLQSTSFAMSANETVQIPFAASGNSAMSISSTGDITAYSYSAEPCYYVTITSDSDATGSATATYTWGTATQTIYITLPNPKLPTSISVSGSSSVEAGQYVDWTITILPSDTSNVGIYIDESRSDWTDIVTIGYMSNMSEGNILVYRLTGQSAGSVTFTFSCQGDTSVSATKTIVVTNPDVMITSISISGASVIGTASNDYVTLTATVTPANATTPKVTWSSSDWQTVGVVSRTDLTAIASGYKAGTVTITATAADGSGVKATHTITVIQTYTALTVSPESPAVEIGKTVTVTGGWTPSTVTGVTGSWDYYYNDKDASDFITLTSSGDVATVTGKAEGKATIMYTATQSAISHTESTLCEITVTAEIVYVSSIEIIQTGGEDCSLGQGETTQFKVTALPENAANRTISISVSNQGNATYATSQTTAGVMIVTVTAPTGSSASDQPDIKFTFSATGIYESTIYATQFVEVLPQWTTGSIESASSQLDGCKLDELYQADVSPYYVAVGSGTTDIWGERWGAYTVTSLTVTDGFGLAVDGTDITGNIDTAGTITITATYSDLDGTAHTVTFEIEAVAVTIALTSATTGTSSMTVTVGDSGTVSGWYYPVDATNVTVSWAVRAGSSNIDMTADGRTATVTGKSSGSATIVFTASQEGTGAFSATVTITVNNGAVAITEIRIGGPDSLVRGESYTYMVSALPATAADRTVSVSVTGGTYETLTTTYGAAVTVTASAGTSITISATSGSISATKTITVLGSGEPTTENVGIVGIADVIDDSMGTSGKNVAGILLYIAILLLAMHILGTRDGGKLMAVIVMIPVTLIFGVLGLVTTDVMLLMIVITVAALAIIRKEGSRWP